MLRDIGELKFCLRNHREKKLFCFGRKKSPLSPKFVHIKGGGGKGVHIKGGVTVP